MMVFDSANEAYKQLIKGVNGAPEFESAPRGKKVREWIAPQIVLTNPLDCLITIKERKLNYRFAVIEKLEYLGGIHDAERLKAYNPNLSGYEGNYGYFDGNYAQRFNYWLDHIYQVLRKDPDSRQAVVSIYDGSARHLSPDIPCTLNLQFLLREGKLHLITTMRSNDLLWGFPYDVNAFCFLQDVLAKWLGVELGNYYHNVGSLHIYEEPIENYNLLVSCVESESYVDRRNPVWNLTYEETKEWLPKFWHMENRLRRLRNEEPGYLPPPLDEYLKLLKTKWIKP